MGKTDVSASGAGNDTLLMDFGIFNQRRTSMLSAVEKLKFDMRPAEMENKVCGTETMMELMSMWEKVAKTSDNFREFYTGCVDKSLVETADSIYAANEQVANSLNRFGNTNNSFNGAKGTPYTYVDTLARQKAGVISAIQGVANASAQGIKDAYVDMMANKNAGAIAAIAGLKGLAAATPNTQFATDNSDILVKIKGLSDEEKTYMLRGYGLSDTAIEEALGSGFTLDTILLSYETFESNDARIFFNKILRQDYEGAFKYLCELEDPNIVIKDKNLMTSLSLYSFGIAQIDGTGNITAESTEKFESFMSAIVNTNGREQNYSADIFKQMYLYSSIEAVAYNDATIGAINSVDEGTYKKMTLEARKRMTISNFYATESSALMDSSIGMGGTPDASVNITRFTLGNLEVDNKLAYDRVQGGKEVEEYNVCVNQNIDAGAINDKNAGVELNKLVKERDELVLKIMNDVTKNTVSSLNPFLGYSVNLMYAINDSNATGSVNDITLMANEVLKNSVDEDVRSAAIKGISISTDAIDYITEYKRINEDMEKDKQIIKTDWFGYNYSYDYETAGDILPSHDESDFIFIKDNPIRPDAYKLMKEWEKGGINSLIINSEALKNSGNNPSRIAGNFDRNFNAVLTSNKDFKKNKDLQILAINLVYGEDGGADIRRELGYTDAKYADLDFNSIDYSDFNKCITILNGIYADTNDGGRYGSVHALWDSRVQEYGGK